MQIVVHIELVHLYHTKYTTVSISFMFLSGLILLSHFLCGFYLHYSIMAESLGVMTNFFIDH